MEEEKENKKTPRGAWYTMAAIIVAVIYVLWKLLPLGEHSGPVKKRVSHSANREEPKPQITRAPRSSYPASAPPPELLTAIRRALKPSASAEKDIAAAQVLLEKTPAAERIEGLVLTLYRQDIAGKNAKERLRIRTSTSRKSKKEMMAGVLELVRKDRLFKKMDTAKDDYQIQLDFVTWSSGKLDLGELKTGVLGSDRFEPGVDGLLAVRSGHNKHYMLPGDAFTQSLLSMNQVEKYLDRKLKGSLSKWSFRRFRTDSYLAHGSGWIPLYRGYPVTEEIDDAELRNLALAGVDYVVRTQLPNGQFLYYYDATTDTGENHEHPDRNWRKNPYYNELRHSGGIMLLLDAYSFTGNKKYLPPARKAIDWFLSILKEYELPDGTKAAYPYYNRKVKLGGSGIGLYAIAEYRKLTGDRRYDKYAKMLAEHLMSQIQETGEFYYYSVYLDKPVDTPERNRELFNFYYPGEAICALASYCKNVASSPGDKERLKKAINHSLDYLLNIRPSQYASYFPSLPSDSWLMMGANELWDMPDMRRSDLRDFVYADADKMVSKMYTAKDALYPDYPGSFYYNYGDQPYPDGARAEGLQAAMELAAKNGDEIRRIKYDSALREVGLATSRLCNIKTSVYSVPNPQKALGGIRFKPTRQWIRVDSVQHVAAFYLRHLRHRYGAFRSSPPCPTPYSPTDES
jgi:hypothetical protein